LGAGVETKGFQVSTYSPGYVSQFATPDSFFADDSFVPPDVDITGRVPENIPDFVNITGRVPENIPDFVNITGRVPVSPTSIRSWASLLPGAVRTAQSVRSAYNAANPVYPYAPGRPYVPGRQADGISPAILFAGGIAIIAILFLGKR
jgi:hypothetical protein